MDYGLNERVAFVTGSSRGIGRATAELFGREGARVVVTYHNHRDKAEDVAAAIHDAVDATLDRWGRIDVLVNNAVAWGTTPPTQAPPFEELPSDEWQPLLRTNVEGVFTALQAVVPAMRAQNWGRIVNISSGVAVDGLPGSSWYAAAKASLHGLTRTLMKELGPDGILVNVVMPGLTLTERNARRLPDAVREGIEQESPIRRLLPPEEVAPTIVFLGSAANTAVTGEVIRASGGT